MTEDEERHADEVNIAFQMGAEWERKQSKARIEKLEAVVEQLRDDNSSLIDSFDKDFLRQEARIEKLEAALRAIIVHCEVPASPNAEALKMFARKALEGKVE
jgi:hypothetical protein